MKKGLVLVFCAMLFLCGCGKKNEPAMSTERKDLKTMETEMMEADKTLPEMVVVHGSDDDAEQNFTAFSDLDYDRVEDYFYAYAKDGGAEEIAVIRMKSADDVSPMMDSINVHLKDRKGTLEEYEPDKVYLVDNAVVTFEGNDVAMIISDRNGLMLEKFKSDKATSDKTEDKAEDKTEDKTE